MMRLTSGPVESAVVLASASRARALMLGHAGVTVITDPAMVDEDAVKRSCRAEGLGAGEVAEALAELKAQRVAPRHPGRLVLGADQMLECDGVWFDKPENRVHARDQLRSLRGRSHRLIACVVAIRDGQRLWHHTEQAELTMRPFGDDFLDAYLDAMGDEVLHTVGAYQLEGLGAQMFTRIRGDYFTILGLPLLPVLDFLRVQGVLAT